MVDSPLGTGVKKEAPGKRDGQGRHVGGASPTVFPETLSQKNH